MKKLYKNYVLLLVVFLLNGTNLHAQSNFISYHGDAATSWWMPSNLEGNAGIAQYPSSEFNFITQLSTRFSPPSGDTLKTFSFFLDSILSGAADSTVSYAGQAISFSWPFPFNHVPQTFLKQAIKFTTPIESKLDAIEIYAGNNISSSDGFNDSLRVSLLRPYLPESETQIYGPETNQAWEFNFPVLTGNTRTGYGKRFTAPRSDIRVNSVQFWVQNMNHNPFLPDGDTAPNDSLIVRLWTVNEAGLPGTEVAKVKQSLSVVKKQAWNEVYFWKFEYDVEEGDEFIFTFEMERVDLQDHMALLSSSAMPTPLNRSIIYENGTWKTISSSISYGSGSANNVELWIRSTYIDPADLTHDPSTPDETNIIASVTMPISAFSAGSYTAVDFSNFEIITEKGVEFWAVTEIIQVGSADRFDFISAGPQTTPSFRSAAYVSDSQGQRWLYIQNTQFDRDYIFRKRAVFEIEGSSDIVDELFLILYDDDNGLPGSFRNLKMFPLQSLNVGAFNAIDIRDWNYTSNGSDVHFALSADFVVNQFAIAGDDGSGSKPSRSAAFFTDGGWTLLSDLNGFGNVNLLMQLNSPTSTNIEYSNDNPNKITLEQNYPNPFNPSTTIRFSLPSAQYIRLSVYNSLGQKVADLVNGMTPAGSTSLNFDASHLSSGIYIYRLSTQNEIMSGKMLLMK